MLLFTLDTTQTNRANYQVQHNVQKLLIDAEIKINPAMFGGMVTQKERAVKLADCFYNAFNGTVNVTKYSPQGNKILVANQPLADLAEICANNEGVVQMYLGSIDPGGFHVYKCKFSVELNNTGSIPLNKETFLTVELSNFNNNNSGNVAQNGTGAMNYDMKLTCYSFSGFLTSNEHIKYTPLVTQPNETRSFDTVSHYMAFFPYSLQRAQLFAASGEIIEFRAEELSLVAADVSDMVFIVDGYPLLHYRWRAVPLQLVHKMQIQLSAPLTTMYITSNKDYEGTPTR